MISLFEAIELLFELPKPVFLPQNLETLGLMHIDSLIKGSIQECTGDIHMSHFERKLGTESEEDSQRSRFDNRSKCFIKVNRFPLVVTSSHEAHFVTFNLAIRSTFTSEDNLVPKKVFNVLTLWVN